MSCLRHSKNRSGIITPKMKSVDVVRSLDNISAAQLAEQRFVPMSHSKLIQEDLILLVTRPQGTHYERVNIARFPLRLEELLERLIFKDLHNRSITQRIRIIVKRAGNVYYENSVVLFGLICFYKHRPYS